MRSPWRGSQKRRFASSAARRRRRASCVGSILNYVASNPVSRLFSLRQEFSSAFARLLHGPQGTPVRIELSDRHLPLVLQGRGLSVSKAVLLLRTAGESPGTFQVSVDGQAVTGFIPDATLGNLHGRPLPAAFSGNLRGAHVLTIDDPGTLAPATRPPGDTSAVDAEKLLDVLLYLEMSVAV